MPRALTSSAAAAATAVLLAVACSSSDEGSLSSGSSGSSGGSSGEPPADSGAETSTTAPDAGKPVDAGPVDAGPTFTGEATYYAADGTGACGFPASPSDLMVAAMNKAQYAKSVCGKCILVTGPKGTVKVRIVDLCPGCASGDVDLSEEAFAKIALLSAGRVKISWSFVTCS